MSEAKYAVIFTSTLQPGNEREYAEAGERMEKLARAQEGFVRMESVRGADGVGITVSYWSSEEAVKQWKWNEEHLAVQKLGREKFYRDFHLTVARIEKEIEWKKST